MSKVIKRIIGSIPGYEIGAVFPDRKPLSSAGIHRPRQVGISGSAGEGACFAKRGYSETDLTDSMLMAPAPSGDSTQQ